MMSEPAQAVSDSWMNEPQSNAAARNGRRTGVGHWDSQIRDLFFLALTVGSKSAPSTLI